MGPTRLILEHTLRWDVPSDATLHMTSWPEPVLYWSAPPARCDAVRFGTQAPLRSNLPPPYLDQQSSNVNYTASRPRRKYHQKLTSQNTPRTYVSNRYRAHYHNQGCTNSCTLAPNICGSLRMELARYNNPFGTQNFEVAIRFFFLNYTPLITRRVFITGNTITL